MTRKIRHLVAASVGKRYTELTNVYAQTYEQALQEAQEWHKDYLHLPLLTIGAQPQGLQAGFCRLPGIVEETMVTRWRVEDVLAERGMSLKQSTVLADLPYSIIYALCHPPFPTSMTPSLEKLARALAIPLSQISETVPVMMEISKHRETMMEETL